MNTSNNYLKYNKVFPKKLNNCHGSIQRKTNIGDNKKPCRLHSAVSLAGLQSLQNHQHKSPEADGTSCHFHT